MTLWKHRTPDKNVLTDRPNRAEELYAASTAEAPFRAAMFTIEQLEVHARALAGSHVVDQRPGKERLLQRLADSEQVIAECHDGVSAAQSAGHRLTPAAEWLLDNFYLIKEQIDLARRHFPRGYSRQLPHLHSGELADFPRIYDLVLQLISHVDGRIDAEALSRYIAAYQSVTPLAMGELWAVPIMLRLALIENLRRVSAGVTWRRIHWERAQAWATRINEASQQHDSAIILALADMVRENPPLSTAFVAQFTQSLRGTGPANAFALTWLDKQLATKGQTLEEAVRAESQSQAADQASMANSIGSLRLVSSLDWHTFVEDHSATEKILRGDPAAVYGQMDFATRDMYRHAVEMFARRLKISEEDVARHAVAVAAANHARAAHPDIMGHVGYVLVDEGKKSFERALRKNQAPQARPTHLPGLKLFVYLGTVALLTAIVAAPLVSQSFEGSAVASIALALCAVVAASQCAVSMVNWLISTIRTPQPLPRMDFEHGIPYEFRTMVVVPTLLTSPRQVVRLLEGLKLRYLGNRDPNLWFALLTDFTDADSEHVDGDDKLLDLIARGVEALNQEYGNGHAGRFFLLHRPRRYNQQEGVWMGRERKRGKLEDFNDLLRGLGAENFSRTVGDLSQLASIRYVITLDTDTDLPWGTGWRLVGTASHPLNRSVLDPAGRRALRGYAILQPRVGISMRSARQSRYSRLLSGDVGVDPYTRVVSDLYQDLFGEASYVGKGIYDVDAFRQLLCKRFPDNAILSHDLLESCYARAGQVSDVELLEEHPSRYLADVNRRHRWMRGDWQISPYLGVLVRDGQGQRVPPRITGLGWWKIFDNLRRTLVAPAYVVLLVLGWAALPNPWVWTLWILGLLFVPELLPAIAELRQRAKDLPWRIHLRAVGRSMARRLGRLLLWLTFLPFEALEAIDAAVRTWYRMVYSKQGRLEWQTAAASERQSAVDWMQTFRQMWIGPALGLVVGLSLLVGGAFYAAAAASPVLLLWLLSSAVAWWVSLPVKARPTGLNASDVRFLRLTARLTWRYFEDFVTARENWLPPDNVQGSASHRIAHRTSPTNMGLSLLANLSAYDMGYVTTAQLLDRTGHTLDSMEQMERYQGHFYNWNDTRTRRPIRPLYISTVDSGNLTGHLRVLQQGLLELPTAALLGPRLLHGLTDTLTALRERVRPEMTATSAKNTAVPAVHDRDQLEMAIRLLSIDTNGLTAGLGRLRDLTLASTRLAGSIDPQIDPEASWWAHAFDRQVQSAMEELLQIAPWVDLPADASDPDLKSLREELDHAVDLQDLGRRAQQGYLDLTASPGRDGKEAWAQALQQGTHNISARLRRVRELADRCLPLAAADFSFLYDAKRKLLSIGYSVSDHRLDNSYYDLLASEARLASFAAIASAELPLEHWFALGRRLTAARGRQVLLSWSGSMFEYLMPLLVMPSFEGTLLDQTCRGAVARQIEYGRQRSVPWGISESCYNLTDAEGNYQYRAFGVPGLGLQRGLSDDVVVSPYAAALALLVAPVDACANLRRMAGRSYLSSYGFFEAIDFTRARLGEGQDEAVIHTFMAHHQGMSLLAIQQAVLGDHMPRRFLANAEFRAAALLLQERIPKAIRVVHPHAGETKVRRGQDARAAEPDMRVFTDPNTPIPNVHLLSNGRYHVMVSAAGGGYSRWHDTALTRWHEDPGAESLGAFCYLSEPHTGRSWSSSLQPTLSSGRGYEAIFTQGRVEFRRQDADIETHTEIAVSAEDDLEIRRIHLTNRSDGPRSVVLTSYAEVVLAPAISDQMHRAFSNLFVQTELLPQRNAILVTRRPRSADERPAWMFCILQADQGGAGACSFETDRARFIGRGKDLRQPDALNDLGPLSGTAGQVLDPCLALRREVAMAPGQSAQLDLIIGAAATREAALALILKYQDHRMSDRVLELATTYSRAILAHLNTSETRAQRFGYLASAVIYPFAAYRAPAELLRRNRKGQSGLWAYGISGDHPIVLLRVSDSDHLRLVREMLMAHAYWRMKGLVTDLVIWNEDVSGYRQVLNDQIVSLISAGTEAQMLDKPGGIFVRHADNIPEEDRVLMQAVARVVVRDSHGTLEQQMERWRRASIPPAGALLAPTRSSPRSAPAVPPSRDLTFFNGTGGFTADGREYVIPLSLGKTPPAPWVNVMANPRLGTIVSESGSSYTWFENAQLFRLTPWNNDPVCDPTGEAVYVRDDLSGQYFSASSSPTPGQTPYVCRHGFGYTIFEHRELGLESYMTTYVAAADPVKFQVLKIKNTSSEKRVISVFASVDLVLGDLPSRTAMHVATEQEPLTGAILARNTYNSDMPKTVAFFDSSEPVRTVTGDRAEFFGRNASLTRPAALQLRQLSGRLGPGFDPCAAMQVRFELAAGAEREVAFILGAGRDSQEAIALVQRYRGVGAARVALEEVWKLWNDTLGVIYAETPDPALNVMMNGWVPYQVLSCRLWGRSGFYQSGGAFGFRDQLQDCLCLMHEMPALAREQILRCAAHQFLEGDVLHWWHPPVGRGVRTRCSDDFLWLAYAVCRYVSFTGDTGVLDEQVPYLTGRQVKPTEETCYDLFNRADESGSLYDHCVRAIQHGFATGPHGLPLMGTGDWNDGMNLVGFGGTGESVWLAFFQHDILAQFTSLAAKRGDKPFADRCQMAASLLAGNIEAHAWDGKWYRRAYFDNGEPLGAAVNVECRIDSLPQSWASITGVGDAQRRRVALDSLWEHLVRKDIGIVQLFDPPFDKAPNDPGYIKGYPPGVRENGGQYTHAAVWAAMAFALAGRTDEAWQLVAMLNPISHSADAEAVARYKVEPYVMAADIYAAPAYPGRGGWTWYTGSAGWFYRLFHEVLLGIERHADELRFQPRVPASWPGFKVHYRYYQTFYHIEFVQDPLHRGASQLKLDGKRQPRAALQLVNDSQEHRVELRFGPLTRD